LIRKGGARCTRQSRSDGAGDRALTGKLAARRLRVLTTLQARGEPPERSFRRDVEDYVGREALFPQLDRFTPAMDVSAMTQQYLHSRLFRS
jgi:urease accessory protein UreF